MICICREHCDNGAKGILEFRNQSSELFVEYCISASYVGLKFYFEFLVSEKILRFGRKTES